VKEIAIYVEGGGDNAQQRAELRNGFDRLLDLQKQAARAKRLGWKLVPSGGRDGAYKNFINAVEQPSEETLCVLLVDSEDRLPPESPVTADETPEQAKQRELTDARARREHLIKRDRWNLRDIRPEQVHLIVQCMETWIVADPERMAAVYGKNFRPEQLPARRDLEEEPKASVYTKLAKATKDTAKGEYSEKNYSKIKHASKLLEKIRPDRVAVRCPRFATFTRWLGKMIDEA
jgi:hypothetical protein